MASKNNRIIIKPGRTHACVCCLLGHTTAPTSHQLRVYSTVDDLAKKKKKKRRKMMMRDRERDDMYVYMAVIKLRLDTQLQAVVIGLKSADRK